MDRNKAQIIESLKKSRDAALAAFDGPQSDWPKQYAPGKWTVRQILAHIADVEMGYFWRYCRAMAEPGCGVYAFDQDRWKAALLYDERPVDLCRGLFIGVRNQLLYFLEAMPESTLGNSVNHSESGIVTATQILNYLCYHTDHHLEQIQFARDGKLWTPREQ